MEKGFKLSSSLKKLLICGASVMMLAGVGATSGSQIANQKSGAQVTAHASSSNYRHIMNYLHWVQRYDHTHAKNIHTWKLAHMYYYMNGLNYWEAKNVKNTINRYHSWYYSNDSTMDTLMNKINGSARKSVVRHTNYRARRAFYAKRSNQYNNVSRYLRWVNWYDAHHAHKFSSWKLRHLNNYMNYLSASQKASFMNQANHFNHIHDYPVRISRRAYRTYRAHKASRRPAIHTVKRTARKAIRHLVPRAHKQATVSFDNNTAEDNNDNSNNNSNSSNDDNSLADIMSGVENQYNANVSKEQAEQDKENQEADEAGQNAPTIHEAKDDWRQDPFFGKTPMSAKVTKDYAGEPIVDQDFGNGTHAYYSPFSNGTKGLYNYSNFKKYQQSNPQGAQAWIMNNKNFSGIIPE